MIDFLLGDIGHGKSTYIIKQIEQDAKNHIRSFLIVPEQQTLSCERAIASQLPPSAQLYCEAISFTRLANKLFREFGGLRYNYKLPRRQISDSNRSKLRSSQDILTLCVTTLYLLCKVVSRLN